MNELFVDPSATVKHMTLEGNLLVAENVAENIKPYIP
jgi:hypothetical protein